MLPNSLSWSRELGHPANPVRQPSDNGPPMGHQWALCRSNQLCRFYCSFYYSAPRNCYAHPSRAIRAYTAPTNKDIFSTQYAVRGGIR